MSNTKLDDVLEILMFVLYRINVKKCDHLRALEHVSKLSRVAANTD